MVRLVVLFAVLLMLSAISLVTARFQSRALFVTSEHLSAQAYELDTEWRRLQLDRAELARNARVDQVARNELNLAPPTPNRTVYVQGERLSASTTTPATGEQP
ncbi:cell division protein FtsL [Alcaligenaceae bacterium CGII-47]|nr:cell division protein FtsL [Alcaligenaceae bacterium CGII-47]